MNNYSFVQMTNKDNRDVQGYELRCDDEPIETLIYNVDKISVKELTKKKKEFFNFICSKYSNDVDRQSLLMIFAYTDGDMLEYYKEQYPIEEKIVGQWIHKGCPKRTEKYNKRITTDEKLFIEIALQKFRNRFGYKKF